MRNRAALTVFQVPNTSIDPDALDKIVQNCRAIVWVAGRELPEQAEAEQLWAIAETAQRIVVILPDGVDPEVATAVKIHLPSLDQPGALIEVLSAQSFARAVPVHREPLARPGFAFVESITGENFLWVPPGSCEIQGVSVELTGYWLARTPVTNRQYALFLGEKPGPEPPRWRDKRFSAPEMPVVAVTWHEAVAYCRWLAEKSGSSVQLPSEAQWEFAARGPEARRYPWGNEPAPTPQLAIFARDWEKEGPAEVGSLLAGAGPFGHLDLAGNVWEWCRDLWAKDYAAAIAGSSKDPVINKGDDDFRPLRGGGWGNPPEGLQSTIRNRGGPGYRFDVFGFRVAVSPASLDS